MADLRHELLVSGVIQASGKQTLSRARVDAYNKQKVLDALNLIFSTVDKIVAQLQADSQPPNQPDPL